MPRLKRKRQQKPIYQEEQLDRLSIDQANFVKYLADQYNDRGIVQRYIEVCLNPSDRGGTTSIEPCDRVTLGETIAL